MSRSYWLSIIAIVGLIICVGSYLAYFQLLSAEKDPYTEANYQPARSPRFPEGWPKTYDPNVKGYEPNCQKPADREDSDLCAQWSAVKVVSETNRLSRIALNVNAFGLLSVLLSLFFSALAALAASNSAKTAVAQIDALVKSERPYVFLQITKAGLKMRSDGSICADGVMEFKFVNHGHTPALLDEFCEHYPIVEGTTAAPTPIDPMIKRGRLLPVGTIASADLPYPLRTNFITQINMDSLLRPNACTSRRIFFQGFIRYSDTFGNHYITGFLAAFSPPHDSWALRGGEKHNYTRKEDPVSIPPHPDYTPENQS